MVPFKIIAEYEAKHNVSVGSNWYLSPDEKFLYFSYGWGVAFAEFRLIQLEAHTLREISRSPQIYDTARGFAWGNNGNLLACSTFKKVYLLDSRDLRLVHKIGKIGDCLDALAFDKSSKYLVIGSYFNPMVKFIDPLRGELQYKKRLGYLTSVCEGLEENEVLLGYGPSGSIRCFNCSTEKVEYEIKCPPFIGFVRLGNEMILGIGLPLPSYFISADMVDDNRIRSALGFSRREEPADLLSFIPTLGEEGLEKLVPHKLGATHDNRPESKTTELAPMPGSEKVHNIVGFARIDLLARKTTRICLMDPLPLVDIESMRLSKSGKRLYLRGKMYADNTYGSVVTIEDFSQECEWILPHNQKLAGLLDEGRSAIVMHSQEGLGLGNPQKFSLLGR